MKHHIIFCQQQKTIFPSHGTLETCFPVELLIAEQQLLENVEAALPWKAVHLIFVLNKELHRLPTNENIKLVITLSTSRQKSGKPFPIMHQLIIIIHVTQWYIWQHAWSVVV